MNATARRPHAGAVRRFFSLWRFTMADPVVLAPMFETGATQASPVPVKLDPGEARMFANMMKAPLAPVGMPGAPNALGDAARAYAAQLTGNIRSYEDMRRSMLEAVDLNDPIKTMFALTDHSMQAHMTFSKLHISTGLASAATSLFGTLLKNQQ